MTIFVSYRRYDSAHMVGRLRDRLRNEFGTDRIFFDSDSIAPGQNFRNEVVSALGRSELMLVVIGQDWVSSRLQDPDDIVRLEVATALRNGTPVVPVLLDDATMPTSAEVPLELAALVNRNAIRLRNGPDFDSDALRLIGSIDGWIRRPPMMPHAQPEYLLRPEERPVQSSTGMQLAAALENSIGLLLVHFHCEWATPSRETAAAARRHVPGTSGIRIVTIDPAREPKSCESYGLIALPAVIVFRDGAEIRRAHGRSACLGLLEDYLIAE